MTYVNSISTIFSILKFTASAKFGEYEFTPILTTVKGLENEYSGPYDTIKIFDLPTIHRAESESYYYECSDYEGREPVYESKLRRPVKRGYEVDSKNIENICFIMKMISIKNIYFMYVSKNCTLVKNI